MLTRRELLKMGAVGSAAVLLPWERVLTAVASAISTPQFAVPFRVLPVLKPYKTDTSTDYYSITMRQADVTILPGKTTRVWAYNGLFPGPTIKARSNRRVVVTQVNNLKVGTTVHLHGAHVAPASDGHPADLISPGSSKDYVYPNSQVASTLWYHDHAMHHTSENVYRGLAGAYLIRDGVEGQLSLPGGAYDVVCILQDRSFNADGSLAFVDSHNAVLGDTIVVNGKPWPNFKVYARKYRLRFVNGSNTRDYELSLDSGKSLVQIASDGGLLAAPYTTPSIRLFPGERVEVVVDFAQYAVGSKVVLKNLAGSSTDGTDKIMRFEVSALPPEPDTSKVPATLRSITRLTGASVTRDFTLSLNRTTGLWVINGKAFDPNRVDVKPKLDVAEIWRLVNSSGMAHPFHMHLAMFQVLDRDGDPNKVDAGEKGWKDTVRVDAGSTVRVITKFTGFTGKYVYHCHNLAHEDHDMMAQMEVVA